MMADVKYHSKMIENEYSKAQKYLLALAAQNKSLFRYH